ncbi:MAG: glycoside hydrolase family 28 protein [Bacteroidetes bacterium]|uniref:Glycoside hydrolase family 28 protein n=1 Tax=Candidatus Cryptobacteroides excrementipullorum TaxID=2840761 RepID=A0A9D9ISX2_9BACT|nr:glycoside hydrolase family 28 protein [Candidatus Cryptobacteroides excrementipullorum]
MDPIRKLTVAVAAILPLSPSCSDGTGNGYSYLYNDLPFEMEAVTLPEIPDLSVDLRDFGAVGDGLTLNSEAFSKAISHLEAAGGGHLVVPDGIWLTGPITLKSNIDLHVTPDAVILFSPERDLYPIVETVFEGLDTRRCISPVNADGARNISITGGGTIDGSGDSWRQVKRSKMAPSQWKSLLLSGGFTNSKGDVWYPDSSSWRGSLVSDSFNVPQGLESDEEWESVKTYLRPVMIGLKECTNVLLKDVTFQNSPCWNIHPLMCRNVTVDNITVRNPSYSQNGDGIDIDSCEGVVIVNSTFDVGDDAICIKSGKDEDGRRRARPTRNLIVDNCTVYRGHGGFVVGSEMSGGVSNISVTRCRFLGTDVGLRFKSCRGRGGVVENIYVSGITMIDIPAEPLLFDLHYGGKSAVESAEDGDGTGYDIEMMPVDETTPEFRNIHINGIVCSGSSRAMYFNGIPEKNISGITVTDCLISSRRGADIRYSDGVVLRDVGIRQEEGPGFSFANCRSVSLAGCTDSSGEVSSEDIFRHNSPDVITEKGKR